MRITEINAPVQPDTYEASMFLSQAIRAGKYAIQIHNLLSNDQEIESWVAKKIDLASGYVSSVAHSLEGQAVQEDAMTSADIERLDKQKYSDKEVRMAKGVAFDKRYKGGNMTGASNAIEKLKKGLSAHPDVADALKRANEDAGEGHMSKSQLYATAKYALQIASMVQPGNDIEGWVQTKMNRAVDMLDAVYHYEDYQRLNPYREQLGDLHQKHAGIVQKNIDQILTTETAIDDVETIPGMLNIMKRRVHEVEKKYAKEVKEGSRMPSSMIKTKEKLDAMSPEEINHFFQKRAHFFGEPARELARSQELRYGKDVAAKAPYSRHVSEEILDEDFKGWLQKMGAAGIIVGSLAGIGSVMNAIDNSVPAIQAMNLALDSAEQRGDTELVAMIQKDLKGAKLRLDIGKDLNQVKYLQDKYKNFMPAGYKSEDKDDQNYPPHLQDLFKKLRDKQAQNKEIDFKVTDATPAGYGPKDDAVNEYSPFKNKVLSKIAKPASDYADKLAALQAIQTDPNTHKDPELKDRLIKRMAQLKTTGESLKTENSC